MRKMKDIAYDRPNRELHVFVHSTDPNIKGARAKGQKFLKLNGVWDGVLWHQRTEHGVASSTVVFRVSSAMMTLKDVTGDVRL